ncbi:MAG: hypothetical protein WAW36_16000 [Methylovulum miyakonense]|uniref:hypothetical protein n=1 Tax=Methylovulum miyakonense TaxID=645578 RepID=UPI003BB6DA5D
MSEHKNRQKRLNLPDFACRWLSDKNHFPKRELPVVERLINSTDCGLLNAFQKIDGVIKDHHYSAYSQWGTLLDWLVHCSVAYPQENANKIRNAKKDFAKKLLEISKLANKLSTLMRLADMKGTEYGLCEKVDFHPLGLLQSTIENQADAETRVMYNRHARDMIEQARNFDLKCYPSINELLDEISRQYTQGYNSTHYSFLVDVNNQTTIANDFFMNFYDELLHQIDIKCFSPKILEEKIITLANWSDIFSVALGVTITEQHIKDFRRKVKNQ